MAKKFFYICAGVFLLVASYHLWAVSATAQAPDPVECVGFSNNAGVAVINHELWSANIGGPPENHGPLPSPLRAVACGYRGVVLENGDVWKWNGAWEYGGRFPLSAPVATQRESWGAVKQRYR